MGSTRIRNIVFACVFALFLLGPGINVAAGLVVDMPDWLTGKDSTQLSRSPNAGVKAYFSVDGAASGELQKAIDYKIGENAPLRTTALLSNAALQRSAVECSNVLFGWDVYPTHFQSRRLVVASSGAVTYVPEELEEEWLDSLESFADDLSALAGRFPDKRIVVYLVQGYETPAVNPAYDMVSSPKTGEAAAAMLAEGFRGSDVVFCTNSYDSLESYYSEYFKTDHHWNHVGIERAYNTIANELGLPQFADVGEHAIEGYEYTGATARFGLDFVTESVSDTNHDFSHLVVTLASGATSPYNHDAFYGRDDAGKKFSYYNSYYDFLPDTAMLSCSGKTGRALLFTDSYGAGILPYIAEQYGETQKLNQLRPSTTFTEDDRFADLLAADGCDDVYLIASPNDIVAFMEICPDYFK